MTSGTDMTTGLTAPPLVARAADIHWHETADVLVIGFGGAGAAAALQARECGADVLAVDRFGGGGATAYSGGVNYAGGATNQQRESGCEATAEEMFKYLAAEGTPLRPDTLRRLCAESRANLEWLEKHGVPYGSRDSQRGRLHQQSRARAGTSAPAR